MRVVAHISDVHFGRTDPLVVAGVTRYLQELQPDITVLSGDLTQRARVEQFEAAKSFLHGLPGAKIVVPGNHDVPLWNLFPTVLHAADAVREDHYQRFSAGEVRSMVGRLAKVPRGFTPKAGATIYYNGQRYVLQAVVPHGQTFKAAVVPK